MEVTGKTELIGIIAAYAIPLPLAVLGILFGGLPWLDTLVSTLLGGPAWAVLIVLALAFLSLGTLVGLIGGIRRMKTNPLFGMAEIVVSIFAIPVFVYALLFVGKL